MSRAWFLAVFVLPVLFAALPLLSVTVGGEGPSAASAVVVTSAPTAASPPADTQLAYGQAIDPSRDCPHASIGPIEG